MSESNETVGEKVVAEPETPQKATWTEAEKYAFLLQIIKQIGGDKLSIKFATLNMPGRTAKSLTHQWAKIKAEVEESGGAAGVTKTPKEPKEPKATSTKRKNKESEDGVDGEPTTPKKTRTPRKKKEVDDGANGDPGTGSPTKKTPAKRKPAAKKEVKSDIKVEEDKAEGSGEDLDEEMLGEA